MIVRRLLLLMFVLLPITPAQAEEAAWSVMREPGAIILLRHANAPGTGDPAGFVLGDCSTQRNLDDRGRGQSHAIGEAFRERGVLVGRVLSSQWCRAKETAELAFPGQVGEEPAFNSFFGNRTDEPEATSKARQILAQWQGPGVLVVVTHQVNITALTGIAPASGEGVVVALRDGTVKVLGRLRPGDPHP
jgi:phosphohistidine phosphatase SixA